MKRFRDIIVESHDPDDGHPPQPIGWDQASQIHKPFGDDDRVVALQHTSANIDARRAYDHGHILRRPGEAMEDFYTRALGVVAAPPGAGWGPAKQLHTSNFENYKKTYNRWTVNPLSLGRGPALPSGLLQIRSTGDTHHFLHPVHRS